MSVVTISFPKGVVLIDEPDMQLFAREKLFIMRPRKTHPYAAVTMGHRKHQYLHRLILRPISGEICDHINHNTLDNRRENLRKITAAQNAWNRQKQGGKAPNTTGFIGVCKARGRFMASYSHENRSIRVGTFDTAEEAALAYDNAITQIRGEFATLNFPHGTPCIISSAPK